MFPANFGQGQMKPASVSRMMLNKCDSHKSLHSLWRMVFVLFSDFLRQFNNYVFY